MSGESQEFSWVDDLNVVLLRDDLVGKRISFCVGGGIAAVETVKIVRELRRYGAMVKVYLSQAAARFITSDALEWASGQPVITHFSGSASHLFTDDLLVVLPSTFDLIGKVISGIGDDVVSCLIASALGLRRNLEIKNSQTVPIIFFPSMHLSLFLNLFFQKNLKLLKQQARVVAILPKEGKIKIPSPDIVAMEVVRACHLEKKETIKGKKILITGGMVPSYLDEIRFLANEASGKTAVEIAREIYLRGADPILLLPDNKLKETPELFPFSTDEVKVFGFRDVDSYWEKIERIIEKENFSLAVFTAGVSDFKLKERYVGKKTSSSPWSVELIPNEKIIEKVKNKFPKLKTVAFKLHSKVSREQLFKAMNSLLEQRHDLVVGNLLEERPTSSSQNWKRYLIKNVSKKQVSKLSGNAIEVDTMKKLVDQIIDLL